MIADTSFIIDLMRGKKEALAKLDEIEKHNRSQFTTSPTVFELSTGIVLSDIPEKEKQKVLKILEQFSTLFLCRDSAWKAGIELGRLYKDGNPVDPVDAQIAGIALIHDQTLITRNSKHFDRFPYLDIEIY